MRVLLINTSERIGGAAVAAGRLLESLKNSSIKAKLLVRDKQTDQISVVELKRSRKHLWNFLWERMVILMANHFKKQHLFAVDIANCGTDVTNLPEFEQADVIHLHWINQGMLSLKSIRKILRSGKPVVWTMHDMWPCTGICHYAATCTHYQTECHHCSYLYKGGERKDLSTRVFRRKQKLYAEGSLHFVTCSKWLKGQAEQSALLRGHDITAIPNAINTNLFRPRDKMEARSKQNLPADKKILLFGSVKITDKRKGIDYLIEACRLLNEKYPDFCKELVVVVFGQQSQGIESKIPFPVYAQNYIHDEKELVNLYNAVDLYVTPSQEDNLPNTIMEAMACGVPCVGFNVGGIPEMIDHLHNGYVATYQSASDFANGIHWALTEGDYAELSEMAFHKVLTHYSEDHVARQYIDLYNKITGQNA